MVEDLPGRWRREPSMSEERAWSGREVRLCGGEGLRCSCIKSHGGPGVGFIRTDSELLSLDSISHKSWHMTLMDVGHKASRSDMWRVTWGTLGKCECSRLMSTRPGSEEGMMERRTVRYSEGWEVWRKGIEKIEWAESRMWKSRVFVETLRKYLLWQFSCHHASLRLCCLKY